MGLIAWPSGPFDGPLGVAGTAVEDEHFEGNSKPTQRTVPPPHVQSRFAENLIDDLLRKGEIGARCRDAMARDGIAEPHGTACKTMSRHRVTQLALTKTPTDRFPAILKTNPEPQPHMRKTESLANRGAFRQAAYKPGSIPIPSPAVGGHTVTSRARRNRVIVHGLTSPASLIRYLRLETTRPGPRIVKLEQR